MNRRTLLAGLLLALAALPALAQDSLNLTILHTNDLHGHILPFAYTEAGLRKTEDPSRGGAARRATLIRRLRREIKNPVLLVDAGDTSTRGPLTNAYEGIADVEAMNAVGYDIGCIGNNEFKLKDGYEASDAAGAQAALLAVVRRAHFPWLCANAGASTSPDGPLLPGVQPFVVREIQGVRVGFLGLTAPRSATYPQTKGWWIGDPVAAAKVWIPKARKECDLLIAVTHIGVDDDKRLAAQTTGLDAIVGGDSHTFLYKAVTVRNADGSREVPIVQSGEFGVNLGRFDLRFSRGADGWKLAGYDYRLIPVGPKIPEASDVAAVAQRYAGPLLSSVAFTLPASAIGRTPQERTIRTTQALMDALRKGTGADFALNPPGSGLYEVFRKVEVTQYDLRFVAPFRNRAATARLTGAQLQEILARSPTSLVSGDRTKLDPARTYTVGFVDYIATSEYKVPAAALTLVGDLRDVVEAALK